MPSPPPLPRPLGLRGSTTIGVQSIAPAALASVTSALVSDDAGVSHGDDQAEPGVSIGEILGEGGMATVRAGQQRILGRPVAVKELHLDSARARDLLMREARVMGILEHPNIVPVHDVVWSEQGRPQIVMRRISGHTWTALLEDEALVVRVAGATDVLEWHLRVLQQVCNAVHFAHSHGIVHRDLKPDNVMIGAFGEVYVMDWGLAVCTRDDGPVGVPRAHLQNNLCGTPAYMAPEMLGEGRQISERTDIFLLGGLLYIILCDHPPYDGPVDDTIFALIREANPPLQGPAELVGLCRRAMAKDPSERCASADEFRLALDRYLRHRAAGPLIDLAQEQLRRLNIHLGAGAAADRIEAYRLHAQVAFGFEQALRIDPERLDAAEGRQTAATQMALYELERGDPDAVTVLIASLEPVPADIAQRLGRLREAKRKEQARVQRLERDRDPNVGRRLRLGIFTVFALAWALLPLAGKPVENMLTGGPSYLLQIGLDLFFLSTFGICVLTLRDWLLTTDVNRWLAGSVSLVLGAQICLDLGGWAMGIPALHGHTLHLFLWAVGAGFTAMVLERRLWIAAVGYLIAWAGSIARPDMLYPLITVTSMLLLAVLAWAWGSPSQGKGMR